MKLKYKFLLPSIVQAVITLCLILYLAVEGGDVLSSLQSNSVNLNRAVDQVHTIINDTDRFFLNELDQNAFARRIENVMADMKSNETVDAELITGEMQGINQLVQDADQLNSSNREIIDEIMALTEHSVTQSSQYIEGTVQKLMDPELREEVTGLERAVIMGASTNTAANLRIQTKVYQLLRDIDSKDELLAFLDKGIDNASKDVEALKGTPFAQLPVAAMEANKKIKGLTLNYIDNVDMLNKLRAEIQAKTKTMLSQLEAISKDSMAHTFSDVYGLGMLLLVILVVVSVALFGFGIVLTRVITRPLLQLRNLVREVAQTGEFSHRLTSHQRDEVGETVNSFNNFLTRLQEAIEEVNEVMASVSKGDFTLKVSSEQKGDLKRLKDSINSSINLLGKTIAQVASTSDQVDTGTKELSQSAQSLAAGATEQAASLEEISSTTSIIDSQTRTNSENADQAKQLTNRMLSIVEDGNKKMEEMLVSMEKINETSTNVSKVIKVIDEIAFQTNLLALNAAVEAARAGKYGKGFAVVAEEVRNLASRSAEAAKNTTELISTSIKEVETGVTNSKQTAEALTQIVEAVEKINDLVGEIAEASREQTTGIDEINKGLTQINSVVQQNSSISEETASSSDELSAQASALSHMISRFRLKADDSEAAESQLSTLEHQDEAVYYLENHS